MLQNQRPSLFHHISFNKIELTFIGRMSILNMYEDGILLRVAECDITLDNNQYGHTIYIEHVDA